MTDLDRFRFDAENVIPSLSDDQLVILLRTITSALYRRNLRSWLALDAAYLALIAELERNAVDAARATPPPLPPR